MSALDDVALTDAELERFWAKVTKGDGDGCWLWTASCRSGGYGQFQVKRGGRNLNRGAHRISFILAGGDIPAGLMLDHLCRVRNCVRPDHLEPVTCRVNLLRGETLTARNAAAVTCPIGHPYDAENTYRKPTGGRQCRTCTRARNREAARARRARAKAVAA